jgi:5-methylcytosine-specific restriction endonuclease McrA
MSADMEAAAARGCGMRPTEATQTIAPSSCGASGAVTALMTSPCRVTDCDRPRRIGGLCSTHYDRIECTHFLSIPGHAPLEKTHMNRQRRLLEYRRWVAEGCFVDIRAAFRWDNDWRRYCLDRRVEADRERLRARMRRREQKTYRIHREALFSWPHRCAYCGGRATAADHIVPRAQNGRHHYDNLAPACHRCNSQKSGHTPTQWKAWCEANGKPWPPAGAVWSPEAARLRARLDEWEAHR